jgi:hypothetical protein
MLEKAIHTPPGPRELIHDALLSIGSRFPYVSTLSLNARMAELALDVRQWLACCGTLDN